MTPSDHDGGYHSGEPSVPDPTNPHVNRLTPHDVISFVDMQWRHFWRVRYGPDRDPDQALLEVDRLIAVTSLSRHSGGGRRSHRYAQMMAGLGHLERFGLIQRRDDLDAGIALLMRSLRDLPVDTPRRELASAELANALFLRAEIDQDEDSLELSIAAGNRAMEAFDGREPRTWLMLHQNQALAYERRWRIAGHRPDLNRAISCWEVLLAAQSGEQTARWEARHCGALLLERAELAWDPADAAAAIILLDQVTRGPQDDPDAWLCWHELGRAYHTQWLLTQLPGSLEAAGRCLDRTLCLGVPDDEEPLLVHLERLAVALQALGLRALHPRHRPARAELAVVVRGARSALDPAPGRGCDPDVCELLRRLIGWAEAWLRGGGTASASRGRLRGLLRVAREICHLPRLRVAVRRYGCRGWAWSGRQSWLTARNGQRLPACGARTRS